MLRWLLRVVLLGVLVTLWWNPLWHEVPRNVLEDSTLGVAVRAEVPRLEENGTFEAPNHTRRAEKPQRVERNRSQDHPANVSGKCSSGHQGGAGRCTSSTECEAERFCHQDDGAGARALDLRALLHQQLWTQRVADEALQWLSKELWCAMPWLHRGAQGLARRSGALRTPHILRFGGD
eukprot:g31683.t2